MITFQDLINLDFHVNPYLNAVIVMVGFFIVAQLFVLVVEKIVLKLVSKTETKIDDLIVQKTKFPISLLLMLIGVRIGITQLGIQNGFYSVLTKIMGSLIILTITWIIIRVIVIIVTEWGEKWAAKTESKTDDQLILILVRTIKIVGFALGIIYVLTVWDIEIGPLLASLGVLGIAVAFALQQTLGNIFGGVSMMVDKAVKVDDVIELEDGTSGKVLDVGIRSTKIRTWNNEVIIVPNGMLANAKIKNIVLPEPKVRVEIPFSVAYGSDINHVKKVVYEEIKKVEGYIDDPAPLVYFKIMSNNGLDFIAYFWVDSYTKRFAAKDQANTLIYQRLAKEKITIPFPQMDVHIVEDRTKKLAKNGTLIEKNVKTQKKTKKPKKES